MGQPSRPPARGTRTVGMCSFDARIRGSTRPPLGEKRERAWLSNKFAKTMIWSTDVLLAEHLQFPLVLIAIAGLQVLTGTVFASGAPDGLNNCTCVFGSSLKADSMRGRTSRQSRPPFPQPNGGTAIELMPNRCISATNARSPRRISSIRDFSLQCRLVGKLTMYRGFTTRPVSQINICPGRTSLARQAVAYASKFSGQACLNCKAMPLPMKPSQLTVLTRASTSAWRRLPVALRIIDRRVTNNTNSDQ
jgi:hypothetical protein